MRKDKDITFIDDDFQLDMISIANEPKAKEVKKAGNEDYNAIGWEGDAAFHGMAYMRDELYKIFGIKKESLIGRI